MEPKLDDKDMEILDILEKNAKIRIHAIAKRLSIPPSTVHHRIKRLESSGAIRRWTIEKGYQVIGLKLKAHIMVLVDVTALKRMRKTQKDIAKAIRGIPNVQAVDIVTGDSDLMVTVRARDMEEFQGTLLERVQAVEGITKTRTMIVVAET